VDVSREGIEHARRHYPRARFERIAADTGLLEQLAGEAPFDIVVSTEVVEHLYDPGAWARTCLGALRPGGVLVCSTPYHGYLKNLALALTNGWDHHLNPLWFGGHIKFFSARSLARLLREAGFTDTCFCGAGRLPGLWKSMVMRAQRP
jgi:2-polyprenyl-6-hydroxyphenyl methylase/3-demethylubiquinone-9 3-methyltransferase